MPPKEPKRFYKSVLLKKTGEVVTLQTDAAMKLLKDGEAEELRNPELQKEGAYKHREMVIGNGPVTK